MKALFDTNVILDVLLDRAPFVEDAAGLLSRVEQSEMTGFVCATTITTISYLAEKALGARAASRHIASLLSLFEIAPVNRIVLEDAMQPGFSDFEDAVIHSSAVHAGAAYIITRNTSDFRNSALPVFDPAEFTDMISALRNET